MEHSLPWRRATFVVSGVAAIELAILLAIAIPMVGKAVAGNVRTAAAERVLAPAPKPVAKPKTAAAAAAPALPREDTSVVVLNGNGLTGAAGHAADRVHELGYLVAGTGNAKRSDYTRTIVMYRPGRKAEGQRLAKDLRAKVVGPLDGLRVRDLMGAHVAVILGAD